jgi:hypothetical protein
MESSTIHSNVGDHKTICNDYKEGDALLCLNQKKRKRKTSVIHKPLDEVASLFEKNANEEKNIGSLRLCEYKLSASKDICRKTNGATTTVRFI